MSAEKRKKILVGFGGTAVVLAAAIAYLSPNFPYRSEDASGAIGAVEKHRQTQITPQDVVLGDEQVKQEQGVLYADYLRDAAQLQNIGAELAAAEQTLELRRLSQAEQALASRGQELNTRFRAQSENALAAMKQLGRSADDFANQLAARGTASLSAADMQALSAQVELAARNAGADSLQMAVEQELSAFAVSLENESALAATPQLATLRNAIEADGLAMRLRSRADYLSAMAREAMSLESARQAMLAKSYSRASQELFAVANELESRAVRNMKASMMFNAERAEQLGRMSQTLKQAESALAVRSEQAGSMQQLEKSRNELAAYNRELMNHAEQLNSRSRYALNAQIEAADSYLSSQANRSQSFAAFAEHFGNMEQLQKRSVLASAAADTQNLAQRAREMANRLAATQRE
ncbi:MAG TPA: hypothetical protein VMS98_16760 [Thermoanaerobaculia bacterium]|nr:hypothetical protein [Thermoanaerobaculia bacterium]